MSHEIRTPMTAILGYSDLMLDENVGAPHARARGGDQTQRRTPPASDQRHSRPLEDRGSEAPDRVDPLLAGTTGGRSRISDAPQAATKQLTLKTELSQPLPETVLTDPLRLRQVLVNLVGNAIKFTDQGEVCIAVRLTTDHGRLGLCFDVTDTGIGMNEEQIGKLFKPFSQVDTSSTRKYGGTGLGLCISKRLAEALGGKIEVRSEPGKGSTFSVTIDPGRRTGRDDTACPRGPAQSAAISDCGSRRQDCSARPILLAEDSLDNQQLIALLLTDAGARVTAVENGQLAVAAALAASEAGDRFDLILMDMQMPVMDGYTATRQLRERGCTSPIVALTAHAMADDCQKCLDAGCNGYAAKPIDRGKLLAMVASWLCRTSGENPSRQDGAVACGKPGGDALPQVERFPKAGAVSEMRGS